MGRCRRALGDPQVPPGPRDERLVAASVASDTLDPEYRVDPDEARRRDDREGRHADRGRRTSARLVDAPVLQVLRGGSSFDPAEPGAIAGSEPQMRRPVPVRVPAVKGLPSAVQPPREALVHHWSPPAPAQWGLPERGRGAVLRVPASTSGRARRARAAELRRPSGPAWASQQARRRKRPQP